MSDKQVNVTVIPAQPDTFVIYKIDGGYEQGEPVIAWRIETTTIGPNEFHSASFPLTADGEMCSNCVGVMNPNKTVTIFEESTYDSLFAAAKEI